MRRLPEAGARGKSVIHAWRHTICRARAAETGTAASLSATASNPMDS
jgi:hypothetical protein